MTVAVTSTLESYLQRHDAAAWTHALDELLPSIHEVDQAATRIWFYFYPLPLHDLLAEADDVEALARRLLLEGNYRIENQIHTSHRFLYGHRFWAEAKAAVQKFAESSSDEPRESLAEVIRGINRQTATAAKRDESLTLGVTAIAVMTLQQVGLERFVAASTEIMLDGSQLKKSPNDILRERARDDSQGLFGFLKTEDKSWTVTFDETATDGKFKCINGEELASGAARDHRDWNKVDPRCIEGPIPVQCRAAACGTCWVGVLGGAHKLSPVSRLEGTKIKEFGYIDTNEERPLIRLACMAQAAGAVSVVIPPWNGVFGKALKRRAAGQPISELKA